VSRHAIEAALYIATSQRARSFGHRHSISNCAKAYDDSRSVASQYTQVTQFCLRNDSARMGTIAA
jgi:hypothetical protein